MHLFLDLGQLCAGKLRGIAAPSFYVTEPATGKQQARISCLAVAADGKKRGVLLCMEPLVLRSYEAVHGSVKSGDPLHINVIDWHSEIERRQHEVDKAYFVVRTDTLSRAPSAHQAAAHAVQAPQPKPLETQAQSAPDAMKVEA